MTPELRARLYEMNRTAAWHLEQADSSLHADWHRAEAQRLTDEVDALVKKAYGE